MSILSEARLALAVGEELELERMLEAFDDMTEDEVDEALTDEIIEEARRQADPGRDTNAWRGEHHAFKAVGHMETAVKHRERLKAAMARAAAAKSPKAKASADRAVAFWSARFKASQDRIKGQLQKSKDRYAKSDIADMKRAADHGVLTTTFAHGTSAKDKAKQALRDQVQYSRLGNNTPAARKRDAAYDNE